MDKVQALADNQRRIEEELEAAHAVKMDAMRARLEQLEAEVSAVAATRDAAPPSATAAGAPVVVELNTAGFEDTLEGAALSAEESSAAARDALASRAGDDMQTAGRLVDAQDANAQSQHIVNQAQIGVEKAAGPIKALERALTSMPTHDGVVRKKLVFNLNDVDRSIESHPSIAKAMAFAKEDDRLGNEIFCAVVPKRGARASDAWLKLHAQTMLPSMMVPKKFFIVERLPTTRKEIASVADVPKAYGRAFKPKPVDPVVHAPAWKYVPQV